MIEWHTWEEREKERERDAIIKRGSLCCAWAQWNKKELSGWWEEKKGKGEREGGSGGDVARGPIHFMHERERKREEGERGERGWALPLSIARRRRRRKAHRQHTAQVG